MKKSKQGKRHSQIIIKDVPYVLDNALINIQNIGTIGNGKTINKMYTRNARLSHTESSKKLNPDLINYMTINNAYKANKKS
jgi:hypothetical protein